MGVCYTVYCPRLDREIPAEACGKIQDEDCSDCENFEPFIRFMIEQERNNSNGKER